MNDEPKRIVVVEPQCSGWEHARFNAALLSTVEEAYPSAALTFHAEPDHLRVVADVLVESRRERPPLRVKSERSRWSPIGWVSLKEEMDRWAVLLTEAKREDLIIFASVRSQTLIALKRLLHRLPGGPTVVAIPHSILWEIEHPGRRFWNRPIQIRAALEMSSPRSLRLIALSDTILASMEEVFPQNFWFRMDHPYMFGAATALRACRESPLVVGIPGAIRHRYADYTQVIEQVQREAPTIRFRLCGHVVGSGREAEGLARMLNVNLNQPLAPGEYCQAASGAHFFLLLSDPVYHRYAASSVVLEALEYECPAITLDHALFVEYCRRLGDIGYIAANTRDVIEILLAAAREFPTTRYLRQIETIAACRSQFAPMEVAKQLRRAAA